VYDTCSAEQAAVEERDAATKTQQGEQAAHAAAVMQFKEERAKEVLQYQRDSEALATEIERINAELRGKDALILELADKVRMFSLCRCFRGRARVLMNFSRVLCARARARRWRACVKSQRK